SPGGVVAWCRALQPGGRGRGCVRAPVPGRLRAEGLPAPADRRRDRRPGGLLPRRRERTAIWILRIPARGRAGDAAVAAFPLSLGAGRGARRPRRRQRPRASDARRDGGAPVVLLVGLDARRRSLRRRRRRPAALAG